MKSYYPPGPPVGTPENAAAVERMRAEAAAEAKILKWSHTCSYVMRERPPAVVESGEAKCVVFSLARSSLPRYTGATWGQVLQAMIDAGVIFLDSPP